MRRESSARNESKGGCITSIATFFFFWVFLLIAFTNLGHGDRNANAEAAKHTADLDTTSPAPPAETLDSAIQNYTVKLAACGKLAATLNNVSSKSRLENALPVCQDSASAVNDILSLGGPTTVWRYCAEAEEARVNSLSALIDMREGMTAPVYDVRDFEAKADMYRREYYWAAFLCQQSRLRAKLDAAAAARSAASGTPEPESSAASSDAAPPAPPTASESESGTLYRLSLLYYQSSGQPPVEEPVDTAPFHSFEACTEYAEKIIPHDRNKHGKAMCSNGNPYDDFAINF